jgi:hypothetical protein
MSKLSDKVKNLLIPRKNQDPVAQPDYGTDTRAIEVWAAQVGKWAGTIQEIVAGANVTVTNGDGPVVTIASTATVSAYASLTGPGQTATPGDLTQEGGFTVNAATHNIPLNVTSGLISLLATNGGVQLDAGTGAADLFITSTGVSIGVGGASPLSTTNWTASNGEIQTKGRSNSTGQAMYETFDLPSAGVSRWMVGIAGVTIPGIVVQNLGNAGPFIGFFGATPRSQPPAITAPTGGTTVDTQARTAIDAIINLLSAAGGGYGLTA